MLNISWKFLEVHKFKRNSFNYSIPINNVVKSFIVHLKTFQVFEYWCNQLQVNNQSIEIFLIQYTLHMQHTSLSLHSIILKKE